MDLRRNNRAPFRLNIKASQHPPKIPLPLVILPFIHSLTVVNKKFKTSVSFFIQAPQNPPKTIVTLHFLINSSWRRLLLPTAVQRTTCSEIDVQSKGTHPTESGLHAPWENEAGHCSSSLLCGLSGRSSDGMEKRGVLHSQLLVSLFSTMFLCRDKQRQLVELC